jgi:hypothetical protein
MDAGIEEAMPAVPLLRSPNAYSTEYSYARRSSPSDLSLSVGS